MNALSNNRLKALAAYRQQKNCEADGVFVVEGIKMALEALQSGWNIRTLCVTAETDMDRLASSETASSPMEVYEAKPEQIERLSSLRTPQGVWMLVERPVVFSHKSQERAKMVLALDGIQDPGNMGTILRTCDWFGVREVLCSRTTVSCYNPKVVQATMGAIFRTHVDYCDLAERLAAMKNDGHTIYGAMLEGEDAFKFQHPHDFQHPSPVLVVGNEGHGISTAVAETINKRLTIPNMGETCESLNAAVAAGILISKFCG